MLTKRSNSKVQGSKQRVNKGNSIKDPTITMPTQHLQPFKIKPKIRQALIQPKMYLLFHSSLKNMKSLSKRIFKSKNSRLLSHRNYSPYTLKAKNINSKCNCHKNLLA